VLRFPELCRHADAVYALVCPQKNHLSGLKRRLLKLSFWNEQQLAEVKRDCFPLVRRNRCTLHLSDFTTTQLL
jgi:hypothetical protein